MIRKARSEEAALLTELGLASKAVWNYPQSYMEIWRDELTISPEDIEKNCFYVYEDEGELRGYCSLIRLEEKLEIAATVLEPGYWLEHLFVRPDRLGEGIGRALFSHLVEHSLGEKAELLRILADPNSKGFYLKMGCRYVEELPSTIEGRTTPLLELDLVRLATERLYSEHAESFSRKIGGLSSYDSYYSKFIEGCRGGEKLLDLACGPGNVAGFMHSLQPGLKVTFVDFSQEMLALAGERVPGASCYKSDIINPAIPEESYELIVCSFGLPYLKREELSTFVGGLKTFARRGTKLYISTMKGDMSRYESLSFAGSEEVVVNYHSREQLKELFAQAGFRESFYDENDYMEQDGSITKDMIIFYEYD